MLNSNPGRSRRQTPAFSLVELLIVLGVIGLLMAISSPSWISNRSMEMNGAAKTTASLFEKARNQAKSFGEPVRVLIHFDPVDTEQYLRRLIVIRRDSVSPIASKAEWIPLPHFLNLENGMFFDYRRPGSATKTMRFAERSGHEATWLYYEFDGDGRPATAMRNVLLTPGRIEDSVDSLQFPNPDLVSGFRITNSGRFLALRKSEEIPLTFQQ